MVEHEKHERALHEEFFGHERITIIEPEQGWRMLNLKELWAYRELAVVLAMRDIKVRYKQTVLGGLWAIIQPFMTMVVFSIFFGRLAGVPSDGYPYPIWAYAGLLPWIFFANAVTGSANSLVGSQHLISKVYFPRLLIPLSSIGSGILDFGVASTVLLAMMLYYGVGWSWNLLAVPLLVLCVSFIALGVGTFLSALTVAYRDFRYVVPFVIQFWMFASPVAYPSSLVPEKWQALYYLNPMAGLIAAFRWAFLGKPFDSHLVFISAAIAVAMFLIGVAYFEKVERRFADII